VELDALAWVGMGVGVGRRVRAAPEPSVGVGVTEWSSLAVLSLVVWLSLTGTGESADPGLLVKAASAITAMIEPTIIAKAPRTRPVMAGALNLGFCTLTLSSGS